MIGQPGGASPRLIVIAGANGAGKTEFTRQALSHQWLSGCVYVNPDDIANEQFGSWNDPQAVLRAAREAARLREACLEQRCPLAFETAFSTAEKVEFLRRAKAAGYFVRLFFIGTDAPRINAARVARRVEEGGHDVPIAKIIRRYYRGLARLAEALPAVDRGYLYDNSAEDATPALQCRTVNGEIHRVYTRGHAWAAEVCRAVSGARMELESENPAEPASRP